MSWLGLIIFYDGLIYILSPEVLQAVIYYLARQVAEECKSVLIAKRSIRFYSIEL
jgi:hypothetical protein